MAHETLGQRLAAIRGRRRMTQRELADASGVSVDVIRKLEQGQRRSARLDTLTVIATTLDVPVAELIGKPTGLPAGTHDTSMLRLRRAVFDLTRADTDPPGPGELRASLGESWRAYWTGRYAPLAAALPGALGVARAAVRAAPSGDRLRTTRAILADHLHLTASLLAHLGHDDLAAFAMHQSLAAAEAAEDPLLVAGLAASRAWLLTRQGLMAEAERLALDTAHQVEPRLSTAPVDQVAIWGENLRYACVTLARSDRHAEAGELLSLVQAAAARVGAQRPQRSWTARITDKSTARAPLAGLGFGPTLAAITAVTIAVAGGRYREALRLEHEVRELDTQSPATRCRHLLTVAWAQMADYRSAEAVSTLRRAEAIAPDGFAHQTIVRTIISELLPRRRRQRLPGLLALAERIGVATG